jgi:hypothetical protein
MRNECPTFDELLWSLVTSTIFVGFQHLMARKIAEIFSFNPSDRPFYPACCFEELSRGSVVCLLYASFETAISQRNNSFFYAKIDDHGIRRGNTGQILLAQCWHPAASRVALDLPCWYWAMHSALYRLVSPLSNKHITWDES